MCCRMEAPVGPCQKKTLHLERGSTLAFLSFIHATASSPEIRVELPKSLE